MSEIEGGELPDDHDHIIDGNPFYTMDELKDDSVFQIHATARRTANRVRTVGKDDRYSEKRADAQAIIDNPAIDSALVPYVDGFAQVHELTLLEAAQLVMQKVSEARAAGAKIETAEDAGKLAVNNAATVAEVMAARDAAINTLEVM